MQFFKSAVVTAVALCAALAVQARTLDEIKKDGKIIVATEGQFAPFNYFEGTKLTGFEVEVAELVVKKMGLKLEWKTLGFDALLTGLGQNRWDAVIASHGVTDERSKAVTFANPHYCSGGIIVSMDDKIRNVKDLTGKVVAVQERQGRLQAGRHAVHRAHRPRHGQGQHRPGRCLEQGVHRSSGRWQLRRRLQEVLQRRRALQLM